MQVRSVQRPSRRLPQHRALRWCATVITSERARRHPKPIPKEGIEMYKYFRNLILNVSSKEAND